VIDRLALRLEVEELYTEYAACLDDDNLERWPELFTEQCVYKIIPRENYERHLPLALMLCESRGMLRDRVEALRRSSVFTPRSLRHLVSGLRIAVVSGESVVAQANYLVLETPLDEPTRIFNAGRYLDTLVRVDDALRFQQRLCVFDSVLVLGSLVYPI
jgi:3-phenylpropionate/cinnamic acid dioxygenase small subunit